MLRLFNQNFIKLYWKFFFKGCRRETRETTFCSLRNLPGQIMKKFYLKSFLIHFANMHIYTYIHTRTHCNKSCKSIRTKPYNYTYLTAKVYKTNYSTKRGGEREDKQTARNEISQILSALQVKYLIFSPVQQQNRRGYTRAPSFNKTHQILNQSAV